MRTVRHLLVAVLLVAGTGSAVRAQIDSPPPALMGQPSYHLYSVPIIRSGGVEPFFECTNTSSAVIRVGVEAFGGPGGAAINDPSATSLDISPSGTVLFGPTNVWVGTNSDPGIAATRGSARILATESKGIICTAFLADVFNAPPTSMVHLTIVKKTKQKGD
jgi:hypothetical protein